MFYVYLTGNKRGGKMHIQDKVQYSDEIFELLDKEAHIYFCVLKGMMHGIQYTLNVITLNCLGSFSLFLSFLKP
jgi:sulfite reductase alpha subunit-like flavoprotein